MTQEEKAKAYDKAIEKIKYVMEHGVSPVLNKEDLQDIFPELAESEDEKIRQKFIKLVKMSSEVGGFALHKWEADEMLAWLEKQGEQKPTDKVESKFKVGDWFIFNGLILHIDEVVNGYYRTTSIGGIHNSYDWNIDNAARLWTIQEANDGDVLAAGDWVFIFRKFHINGFPKCHCHYDLTLEEFKVDTDSYMAGGGDIYPATEEQRELLFQKMKEAGYVWDSENIDVIRLEKQGE